jgi:thiol-disulfide isomerase/thioredoxin/uncharacterized membrane protein YphA (DoxX/SURF4 family)
MEIVLLIIRLVLFGVFALAGIGKLLDLGGSEKAVRAFGMNDPFAKPFAVLIPIADVIFACSFLFVGMSWVGAIGGLILLVSFIGGMIWQMRQGNAPDCHCFGQIHSEPVGPKSLIRNFIIAGLAAVLVLNGRETQGLRLGGTNGEIAQNVALATITVVIIIIASYLHKLLVENRSLKRRVELLEMLDNGGAPIERDEAGNPLDALPIGAQFPDFQLPDTNGRIVMFEHLLADYKPKIFVFVGPKCEPCKQLIPEFIAWQKEFDGRIKFVFVSSGPTGENIERFGSEIGNGVLLQKNKELANIIYAKWTPTAVFVSSQGTIAGHPAVGDTAIRDMIDRLRSETFTANRFYLSNGNKPGRIKIGQAVPEFSLPDLDGNLITKGYFQGVQTLAVFLSTTCTYCAGVVEQIREWENSNVSNDTKVIVFSEGDRDLHVEFGLKSPVVIENGYITAGKLGMFGVPSGVLIDENGMIASETATGGPAIWSLIGKYK